MRCVKSLLALLTRLPVGEASLEDAARCFWLTPLLLPPIASASAAPLMLRLEPQLAAVLALVLHHAILGYMHLDGFADVVDALASGRRGLEALRVARDPRVGSAAAAAVTVHTLVVYASLYTLAARGREALTAMLASYTLSYAGMLLHLALLPPEPHHGMARVFQEALRRTKPRLLAATALSAAVPTMLNARVTLVEAAAAAAALYASSRLVLETLGFATGDTAGFTYELIRAATLFTAALYTTL